MRYRYGSDGLVQNMVARHHVYMDAKVANPGRWSRVAPIDLSRQFLDKSIDGFVVVA